VPKKSKPAKRRPEGVTRDKCQVTGKAKAVGRESSRAENKIGHPVPPAHFELREDGTVVGQASRLSPSSPAPTEVSETGKMPVLHFSSDTPFIRLYHGNSLELLDAIAAKYPDGRFDAIFADPPYFLSNGGIIPQSGTK